MAPVPGPISVEASKTRRHLRDLCKHIAAKTESGTVPDGVDANSKYLADCFDRFNIWAGSLGVFQKGDSSLDARLSNHILAREVLRLLKQLDNVLSDLWNIIDGEREQATWTRSSLHISPDEFSDTSSYSDDEREAALVSETSPEDENLIDADPDKLITESEDLHLSVNESITSLLRLSIQVHRSSRKAKFAKSSIHEDYAIGPDISHVRDFFPHLDASGNIALAERLGKANAQRRQWLWYRRRHREKLSVDFSGTANEGMPPLNEWPERPGDQRRDGDTETIALFSVDEEVPGASWSPSLVSGTRASTFRSRATATSLLSPSNAPPETLFGRSSKAAASEQKLLVPELPRDLIFNQPYSCRYCCNIVEISGRHAWQRHVHSDLSSYTCLADSCDELFFESRNKWWAHEMEAHRKKWTCGICKASVPSMAVMKTHIREKHADQVRVDQIDDVAFRFGRPVTAFHASDCPLCDYSTILQQRGFSNEEIARIPVDTFGKHLGRHLEQLALFILPNTDLVDEDDLSTEEGDDNDSHDGNSESGQHEPTPSDDLIQKLAEVVALQQNNDPDQLTGSPDLAMRWQPPQDFTPPLEDFDPEDPANLPGRQEPIYGGDLHTAGWARGTGRRKEGFCARCPVSHWVNIADGSYRFHLTYFHGVPDSGVPLPRPSTIRPAQGKPNVWEGFCKACDDWKVLKKTPRGWNWYRHWLNDHADIVKHRTEAIRNGVSPEAVQLQRGGAEPNVEPALAAAIQDPLALEATLQRQPELLNDKNFIAAQLAFLATHDMEEAMEKFIASIQAARKVTRDELSRLADATLKTGETLLLASAAQGLGRIVQLLLGIGADVNATFGPDQQTALDLAADAGYFAIAYRLVACGASISRSHVFTKIMSNEREYAGESTTTPAGKQAAPGWASKINPDMLGPLGRAAFEGDTTSAAKLLESDDVGRSRGDIEEGAEAGYSPFLLASMGGHLAMMDFLLAQGANINTTSKHGWTPLMLASKRGDEACVRWLIDRGADVNHLSPDRWTALSEATNNGFTQIMALLLDAGADPEIRAQSDWSPLMHAAYRGDIEAVNMLLDAGAVFDEISSRDATPMLLSAAAGSVAVVKRLLDEGCPPDSMWSRAAESQAGSEGSTGVGSAATAPKQQQERIERLYRVGWTPLMVACQVGSLEVVAMLLDAGANPEPKSPMFKTALDIARENGKIDVVEYLERSLGERGTETA